MDWVKLLLRLALGAFGGGWTAIEQLVAGFTKGLVKTTLEAKNAPRGTRFHTAGKRRMDDIYDVINDQRMWRAASQAARGGGPGNAGGAADGR